MLPAIGPLALPKSHRVAGRMTGDVASRSRRRRALCAASAGRRPGSSASRPGRQARSRQGADRVPRPLAARHLRLGIRLVIVALETEKSRATNRTILEGYGRDHVATRSQQLVVSICCNEPRSTTARGLGRTTDSTDQFAAGAAIAGVQLESRPSRPASSATADRRSLASTRADVGHSRHSSCEAPGLRMARDRAPGALPPRRGCRCQRRPRAAQPH